MYTTLLRLLRHPCCIIWSAYLACIALIVLSHTLYTMAWTGGANDLWFENDQGVLHIEVSYPWTTQGAAGYVTEWEYPRLGRGYLFDGGIELLPTGRMFVWCQAGAWIPLAGVIVIHVILYLTGALTTALGGHAEK